MTRRLVAVSLLMFAAGCAPAAQPDTRAQDEAAIRANEVAWSAAMKAKDAAKFTSYYAPDAVVMPPNEPMLTTPDAVQKSFTEFFKMPGLNISFKTTGVSVARSGDMAYSYGTYEMTATGPDGKPISDNGKYTTVWKKQADGSWKSVVDMFNTSVPMAPPPGPAKGK
jgi:uncharacterized protein (TIGR02246 family)